MIPARVVPELVAEDEGQLVLALDFFHEPGGDENLAARKGERIRELVVEKPDAQAVGPLGPLGPMFGDTGNQILEMPFIGAFVFSPRPMDELLEVGKDPGLPGARDVGYEAVDEKRHRAENDAHDCGEAEQHHEPVFDGRARRGVDVVPRQARLESHGAAGARRASFSPVPKARISTAAVPLLLPDELAMRDVSSRTLLIA